MYSAHTGNHLRRPDRVKTQDLRTYLLITYVALDFRCPLQTKGKKAYILGGHILAWVEPAAATSKLSF